MKKVTLRNMSSGEEELISVKDAAGRMASHSA